MIVIAIILAVIVGFFVGRYTVKFTYGGDLLVARTEEGKIQFMLEVATDVDTLDQKKAVIFKVVQKQEALF